MMKRILLIAAACLLAYACVGQKEDPDPVVDPVVTPEPDPEPDPEPEPGPEPEPEVKPYFRRSLLLDFTGTWCVNCPRMEVAIGEIRTARPDRIVPVAVHYADAMKSDAGNALVKRFGVKAYPSAVIDLDPESLVTVTSPELLLSHVDRLLEARPEAAGIRVESTLSEGKLRAHVAATPVREGDYSLHLAVLEDGIVAAQTGGEKDEVHDHVLRQWIDSEVFAACAAGAEIAFDVETPCAEGMRLVAIVCRDGLVDNVLPCAAGATADFAYENNGL